MTQAINGLNIPPPGSGNGGNNGGGNTGGGNTGNTNPAVEAVISAALSKLGAPYKLGAQGPDRFDCSGLVYWSFVTAGEAHLMGGNRLLAAGYAHWFANHGQYSHDISQARRGDLITFTHGSAHISHIAIYLGNHHIVSALVNPNGVTRTRLHGINVTPAGVCLVNYPNQQAQTANDLAPGSETDQEAGVTGSPSDSTQQRGDSTT